MKKQRKKTKNQIYILFFPYIFDNIFIEIFLLASKYHQKKKIAQIRLANLNSDLTEHNKELKSTIDELKEEYL